ncbi:UNVERIFIED_CONTAM: hypothetical protein FKN15_049604 [Acipenser sinensis]
MTSASSYVQSMTCRYSPWAEREILCERNYMEVSVRRGVPLIEPNFVQDDPDWSLAYPEATAADNSIWKIVFHLPANRKTTMTVAQAMTNGYGINTTPTRILVRAAYNSTECQSQGIQTLPMAVLRSTTFYKQRWMVMMVDTAVTCPTDGTAFTEQMITWNVPRVLPPLVPTPQITTLDVQMGVDGRKLDPATIHNRDYKLDVGPQLITVKIHVGADGGYYKSHVLDNTYVVSYSIEPMLEHTWQDGPEKTKYTVLHPITTPFMPRPPVVTNNTVPKARVFNVTLGTFLPDVELVKIIVGPETLTVPEANLKGYNVQEHVFPNGSKTYTLQVPFEDPNVKQKVTPPDTRTYILPLTYLLNIVPENTPFTHPAVVEAILRHHCENSADEYLTIFHPVSSNARVLFPSHVKRFEVKMFSFTSSQDVLKGQNSADEYLTIFHPVSSNARVLFPSHVKRFEVKMFSFTSSQDVLKGQVKWSVGMGVLYHNAWFGLLCKQQIVAVLKSLVSWNENI